MRETQSAPLSPVELNAAESMDSTVNFRKAERREWWLWATAGLITLMLTGALLSFFLPGESGRWSANSIKEMPAVVRGLLGLVFLFNLYVLYQQVQIHRIRRQLIERETLFQLISDHAADMIAVVDTQGRRIFNSASYKKILGYSQEELRASLGFEQIHPDDRQRVVQAAEEARRTGIGQTLEYRIRHKNGAWLHLESTSSVIRDSNGEPVQLVIVNRNITERKRAEEALSESNASFRAMVEDAPYGIYRAKSEGRLSLVNPALQKMLGYESTEELLKVDLGTEIFRHPGEYQRMQEALRAGQEIKDVEVEWKRRDGAAIIVRCSGHVARKHANPSAGFEIFAQDITEKRVLERQLRLAQKMEAVGRLSGGIAHDFNNLLGVIIGYSGVLKKVLKTGDPAYDHALEIEKAGQRAASLTRQLLAFSRQQVLTPTVVNLNSLFQDMAKMLPRLLGEDVRVETALAPDLANVKADQSQIEQTIMNLAVNARDAMPTGGKLTIATANVALDEDYVRDHPGSRVGNYVKLTITDSGTGMDADTLTHIFEPFFTTKEVGKGTGLGLATVYGVVKQSNGYIWVDSAPGQGASFQIYLPQHAEEVTAPEQKPQTRNMPRGSRTILLVEDADALRNLARSILEANGFRVRTAANGEEALELLAREPVVFDLLLTDVVMPGMNGRALAEQLLARHPRTKVLYMTGYTDSFVVGPGALGAGTKLLHKPFTAEVLIAKVCEVLDSEDREPAADVDPRDAHPAAAEEVPARR